MSEVNIRSRRTSKGEITYSYFFEIATVDGKRKWKTKGGFKTKSDAKRAGKEAQLQYENFGVVVAKDEISFSDFLDYWMENDCKIDLKPVTLRHYEFKVKNLLKPCLGKYRLKSITREILQAFLIDMYDKGYSYNSLTSIKGLLTKSLNYAMDHHYIAYSPAVRLKIPKNRVPKIPTRVQPHQFITFEEMEKIFARFPEKTSSYIPLKLGYECGLRIGEIFALCWEDVDFNTGVIKVNRQVQWLADSERAEIDKLEKNGSSACGNGYWYFASPKYNSYRIIEMSDELTELLLRERARQVKAQDYYGAYYTNYYSDKALIFSGKAPEFFYDINRISCDDGGFPIHFVCVRENGTFISPRAMQHTSQVIKKEICKGFDFHSLRHTHASMLAEMGVEQKYIQTRLGHSNINITIDVYEHTTDIMRERGRQAINKIYK